MGPKPLPFCRVCGEEITGERGGCTHERCAVYPDEPHQRLQRRTYDSRLREGFRIISRGGDC